MSLVSCLSKHGFRSLVTTRPTIAATSSRTWLSVSKRNLGTESGALTDEEIDASINKLSQGTPFPWTKIEGRNAISKTFTFVNFSQAWSFMSQTALLAEKMDHHPEWFNLYNRVEVTLTTHDCDGVSLKDLKMAKEMESYAKCLLPSHE